MSKLLVLSNQKGGVGKSTLAILIANHMAELGLCVGVIELDVQRSINNKRRTDINNFGEDEMPYPVRYQEPRNFQESADLVKNLKGANDDFIFIVDLPGKLDDETLIPFLINADYVLCPFQYETMCLESTTSFIKVMNVLSERFKANPVLVFCPNMINLRYGTNAEKEGWKRVDEVMKKYGIVVPAVTDAAEMKRINTYENNAKQKSVSERFLKEIENLMKVNS